MPAAARPTHAHSHAGEQAGAKPKLYNPRHPERALLYQTIADHRTSKIFLQTLHKQSE
jgi:hypothetical protein